MSAGAIGVSSSKPLLCTTSAFFSPSFCTVHAHKQLNEQKNSSTDGVFDNVRKCHWGEVIQAAAVHDERLFQPQLLHGARACTIE
jgi:hypothetical protein